MSTGASTPAPQRAPGPVIASTWMQAPALQAAGYWVDVVGESHYQPAIDAAAGGRTSSGARVPLVTAVLVREPRNPHDRNAVRVDIDGQVAGYISKDEAPAFHTVLGALDRDGRQATCRAWLTGGWDRGQFDRGHFGVRLDLHPQLQLSHGPMLLPFGDGRVSITGEQHCQGHLSAMLAASDRVETIATLARVEDRVSVTVGDVTVGQMTPKMSTRYTPWVAEVLAAGLPALCDARVIRMPNKIEVFLKLAKPWNTED